MMSYERFFVTTSFCKDVLVSKQILATDAISQVEKDDRQIFLILALHNPPS